MLKAPNLQDGIGQGNDISKIFYLLTCLYEKQLSKGDLTKYFKMVILDTLILKSFNHFSEKNLPQFRNRLCLNNNYFSFSF